MVRAEYLFGAGLVCMAGAAGLCQFVMIGLVGVALLLVAIVLLVKAGWRAQTLGKTSFHHLLGMTLYAAGVLMLVGTAFYASLLVYDSALSKMRDIAAPATTDWVLLGIASLVPALLMSVGLWLLTAWSVRRCAIAGAGVLAVCPAALLIFWFLAPVLPLTA